MDYPVANHILNEHESASGDENTDRSSVNSAKTKPSEFAEALRAALLVCPSSPKQTNLHDGEHISPRQPGLGPRILNFSQDDSDDLETRSPSSPLAPAKLATVKSPHRHIASEPIKILDAPDIVDDYCAFTVILISKYNSSLNNIFSFNSYAFSSRPEPHLMELIEPTRGRPRILRLHLECRHELRAAAMPAELRGRCHVGVVALRRRQGRPPRRRHQLAHHPSVGRAAGNAGANAAGPHRTRGLLVLEPAPPVAPQQRLKGLVHFESRRAGPRPR